MKTFIIVVGHGVIAEDKREFFITAETAKDAYWAAKSHLRYCGEVDGYEYILEVEEVEEADKKMSVNTYLDTADIDDEQVVVIYNDKHNIHWVGRAGWAPLNCRFEFKNAVRKGNELIINGLTESMKVKAAEATTTETTEATETTETENAVATREETEEIIERAHHLRKTPYGKYFYRDDLRRIISDVMKFKYYVFYGVRQYSFDLQKVEAVEKYLVDNNLVIFSKKGNMFRFT